MITYVWKLEDLSVSDFLHWLQSEIEAWMYNAELQDQRLPHKYYPNQTVPSQHVHGTSSGDSVYKLLIIFRLKSI